MSFDDLWSAIEPIGRHPRTGGYHRFAWTAEDATLREWFAGEAEVRGLDLTTDRAGNQWAWWGDPDAAVAAGRPGVVIGSHLDSVPDGGAFDGPLGVVSAFAVLDALRERNTTPNRPVAKRSTASCGCWCRSIATAHCTKCWYLSPPGNRCWIRRRNES